MTEWPIRLAASKTFLFVPGNKPDRFSKAVASGADVVVLDLEDAVSPDDKDAARQSVRDALEAGARCVVRINGIGTPWHAADMQALAGAPCGLMVPKSEDADALAELTSQLPQGSAVVALVETASGVLAAERLAAIPGVARLAFGSFDLAAELGVSPDDREAMASARGLLVLGSAAAGLGAPIDGVTGAIHDDALLRSDVAYARRLGFGGKLCIHPRQVAVARDALAPSEQELAWATEIVEAVARHDGGVLTVAGRMVDQPVLNRATRLLAEAVQHDRTNPDE